ncbi:MAG: hypothetical protein KGI54_17160 [Pseudomonadota bacterium]|nr:hypothetical protein [Pseudomonadota bacterium]
MLTRIKSFFTGLFRDYDEPDGFAETYHATDSLACSRPFLHPERAVNAVGPAKDYADDPKEASLRQAFVAPKPRKYIYWDKKRQKWRVRVGQRHVGYFPTLSLAVKARNAYCKGAGIKMGRGA